MAAWLAIANPFVLLHCLGSAICGYEGQKKMEKGEIGVWGVERLEVGVGGGGWGVLQHGEYLLNDILQPVSRKLGN